LPEALLLAKDISREMVVRSVMYAANVAVLRPLWRGLVGRSTINAINAAGRLFIHIPKTGGTSISYCLYKRNLPHLTARFYREMYGDRLAGIPSFSVLRNPVERLASCYRFLKYGGSSIVAVSRYDMARLGSLDTFDNFVAFLHEDPSRIRLAQALAPQTGFVCDETGNVLVDRLFRMTTTGFLEDLTAWLGLDQLPKLNISSAEPISMTRKTSMRIEDLYSSDVELFYAQPMP